MTNPITLFIWLKLDSIPDRMVSAEEHLNDYRHYLSVLKTPRLSTLGSDN